MLPSGARIRDETVQNVAARSKPHRQESDGPGAHPRHAGQGVAVFAWFVGFHPLLE